MDEILQARRDKRTAKRLLKSLIKRHVIPRRIVTHKLRSYGAEKRRISLHVYPDRLVVTVDLRAVYVAGLL